MNLYKIQKPSWKNYISINCELDILPQSKFFLVRLAVEGSPGSQSAPVPHAFRLEKISNNRNIVKRFTKGDRGFELGSTRGTNPASSRPGTSTLPPQRFSY